MAMPPIVRRVYLMLFALRRAEFVTLDTQQAARHGIRPGRALKFVAIPAPTISSLAVGFVLNSAIISLFVLSAVYKLSPGDYAAAIGPTLVFGLHATLRMAWKIRERVSIQADWPVPIARQKQWFLALAAVLGLLVGTLTTYWFLRSLSTPIEKPTILTACFVVGAIEMIRNSIRIGGKFEIPNFSINDHTRYFPDDD